jgi:hypothetical protein
MSAASATVAPVQNPAPERDASKEDARWQPVLALPCLLSVDISLPGFRVSDVPLRVNGILIGWGELEAAGARLAVRVTELA